MYVFIKERASFICRTSVRWLFLEWYGTLGAVSAPLVMPHNSGIPMNVPITFRTKATIT